MTRNAHNDEKIVQVISNASKNTGAITGTVVDTKDFENCVFQIHHGAWGGGATLDDQIIEEADDALMTTPTTIATFADRSVADAADPINSGEVIPRNHKRFLRYSGVVGTAAHIVGVTARLSGAKRQEAVPGDGVPAASGSQFEFSV